MHGAGGTRNQCVGCRGSLLFVDVAMPCLSRCVSFLQRDCLAGKGGSSRGGWRGLGCLAALCLPPPPPRALPLPGHHTLGPTPTSQLPSPPPHPRLWTVVSLAGLSPSCFVFWGCQQFAGHWRYASFASHRGYGLLFCVTVITLFLSFLCIYSCCIGLERNSTTSFS